MFTFPKPKLGTVCSITVTSSDLDESAGFYKKLGFHEIFRSDFPFPLLHMSDGAILLLIRQDKTPYISLSYYTPELESVVASLKAEGVEVEKIPTANPIIQRYVIKTQEGHNVALVTFVDGFVQPTGTTLLTMPPQDYANPDKYVNKICGIFGEFAFPVSDLEKSILFWEKLGLKVLSKRSAPYPWAILSDGLSIVGLHQTTTFDSPAITYFASDMGTKISKLKESGLSNFVEKGSESIILTTPEQQKINLFKLGM